MDTVVFSGGRIRVRTVRYTLEHTDRAVVRRPLHRPPARIGNLVPAGGEERLLNRPAARAMVRSMAAPGRPGGGSHIHRQPGDPVAAPDRLLDDVPATRRAVGREPADCCVAQPAYRVVIPAGPTRRRPAQLLLCGHHFRAGRAGLARAGADVYDAEDRLIATGGVLERTCP